MKSVYVCKDNFIFQSWSEKIVKSEDDQRATANK